MSDHACAGVHCRLCDHRGVDVLDRPGSARRTDPDTSKDAAMFVKARATSARVRLARSFYLAGDPGLTAEEACLVADLPLSSEYATRTSELMRIGVIAATGGSRPGRQGLDRQVYAITSAGRVLVESRGDS